MIVCRVGTVRKPALPLRPGKNITIYVAGEGIDQIPAAGVATSSPFILVNPETVADEAFDVDDLGGQDSGRGRANAWNRNDLRMAGVGAIESRGIDAERCDHPEVAGFGIGFENRHLFAAIHAVDLEGRRSPLGRNQLDQRLAIPRDRLKLPARPGAS